MNSATDTTEQDWLKALRKDDESALRSIFDRHYALLLRDVSRLIADEDTGKDIVQETFVELWRKRAELDIHTSLRAYLRRAAVNRALNYLKTKRPLFIDDTTEMTVAVDTSTGDMAQQQRQESLESALHRAIAALPEKCRVVFSLSRFENQSHREIAEQLGISVKTIENQITKAMKTLREALAEYRHLSSIGILLLKWWLYR